MRMDIEEIRKSTPVVSAARSRAHCALECLHMENCNAIKYETSELSTQCFLFILYWLGTAYIMTSSNGNFFSVTGHLCGKFTGQRWIPRTKPVTRSFDVFFDLRLNKHLSKQWWCWWFETPSYPLWRHCDVACVRRMEFQKRCAQIQLISVLHGIHCRYLSWRMEHEVLWGYNQLHLKCIFFSFTCFCWAIKLVFCYRTFCPSRSIDTYI